MYETTINEPVEVWVLFSQGLSPIAMKWQNRLIKFKDLILTTNKHVGQIKIISLTCSSESANFELEYNTQNHQWKLIRMMPHEG